MLAYEAFEGQSFAEDEALEAFADGDLIDAAVFELEEPDISVGELEDMLFAAAEAASEEEGSFEDPDQIFPLIAGLIPKLAPLLGGLLGRFLRESEQGPDPFLGRLIPAIAKTIFGRVLRRRRRGRRVSTRQVWRAFVMLLKRVLANRALRRRYMILSRRIMARMGGTRRRRRYGRY
ncbi:MAG: hypothetical protein QNJ92_12695 [Alphaproteobacteria bacterium]|nr:hypothetical protein [Alphaproteobacteria bacterium]